MKVAKPLYLRDQARRNADLYSKYGLTVSEWDEMLIHQAGRCACCRKPLSGAIFTDHEHVSGYSKMEGALKRKHVRGLLCYQCNRYRVAKNTADDVLQVTRYLLAHRFGPQVDQDMVIISRELLVAMEMAMAMHAPHSGVKA